MINNSHDLWRSKCCNAPVTGMGVSDSIAEPPGCTKCGDRCTPVWDEGEKELDQDDSEDQDTTLNEMVRDFTSVGSRPKSEVRRRILAYGKKCKEDTLNPR